MQVSASLPVSPLWHLVNVCGEVLTAQEGRQALGMDRPGHSALNSSGDTGPGHPIQKNLPYTPTPIILHCFLFLYPAFFLALIYLSSYLAVCQLAYPSRPVRHYLRKGLLSSGKVDSYILLYLCISTSISMPTFIAIHRP